MESRVGAAQSRRIKIKKEEISALTRQRISFLISPELNRAVEEIYQEEASKAVSKGISAPARSRIFEELLARGVRFRQEKKPVQPEKQDAQTAQ